MGFVFSRRGEEGARRREHGLEREGFAGRNPPRLGHFRLLKEERRGRVRERRLEPDEHPAGIEGEAAVDLAARILRLDLHQQTDPPAVREP